MKKLCLFILLVVMAVLIVSCSSSFGDVAKKRMYKAFISKIESTDYKLYHDSIHIQTDSFFYAQITATHKGEELTFYNSLCYEYFALLDENGEYREELIDIHPLYSPQKGLRIVTHEFVEEYWDNFSKRYPGKDEWEVTYIVLPSFARIFINAGDFVAALENER